MTALPVAERSQRLLIEIEQTPKQTHFVALQPAKEHGGVLVKKIQEIFLFLLTQSKADKKTIRSRAFLQQSADFLNDLKRNHEHLCAKRRSTKLARV